MCQVIYIVQSEYLDPNGLPISPTHYVEVAAGDPESAVILARQKTKSYKRCWIEEVWLKCGDRP